MHQAIAALADEFTTEDAKQLAFDETWVTAAPWIDALNNALTQFPNWLQEHQGEAADLAQRLRGFDGIAAADSVAALNFYYWHKGMGEVLQRPGFETLQALPWNQQDFSPEFAAALLAQAVRAAAHYLQCFIKRHKPTFCLSLSETAAQSLKSPSGHRAKLL